MAVEFLTDPGVEFLDPGQDNSPETQSAKLARPVVMSAGGSEFLAEPAEPATPEDIERRLGDLNYAPTRAEFDVWNKAQKDASWWQPARWADKAVAAAGSTASMLANAVKEVHGLSVADLGQTILEAGGRGILQDADLVNKIAIRAKNLVSPGMPNALSESQFIAQKVMDEAYPDGVIQSPNTPPPPIPADTRRRLQEEYRTQYLPAIEYENFLNNRESIRQVANRGNVVPEVLGQAKNDLAEAGSMVLSPVGIATLGVGGEGELLAKGLGKTVEGLGTGTRATGRGFERVGELPGRAIAGTVQAATDNPELAARARAWAKGSTLAATVVSPAIHVPGLSQVAIGAEAAKRTGQLFDVGGETAQAAGRALADPILETKGLLWNISKDAETPLWLRKAAGAATALDPALTMAGRTAESAAIGAGVGAGLGLVTDGPEGAASGLGSGAVIGGAFGLAGRLGNREGIRTAAEDRDLAHWLGSKSTPEIENIRALDLSRAEALRTMETEYMARGLVGPKAGDVNVIRASPEEFERQYGSGKGVQIIQGDKPTIIINTGYKGPRTLFHEIGHAVGELDAPELEPSRKQLEKVLFENRAPDGTLLNKGLYDAHDLAAFEQQYLARSSPEQRTGWLTLTPEERTAKIRNEVIAESWSNLLSDRQPLPMIKDSVRRRVADRMLMSNDLSLLGRARKALEAVGVTFRASGEPSELFFKTGRPLTNTLAVDAALRSFMRAKDRIVRKLTAGDAEPVNARVSPFDFMKRGNESLVDAFRDWDGFAREPDGSVQMRNGSPVMATERQIAKLQEDRIGEMIQRLRSAPSSELNAMHEEPNGSWSGKFFSDAQIQALKAMPPHLLSPSMKAKLEKLNAMAKEPGNQILLDYNAALRKRKYSSGIAATTRTAVVIQFKISKAGNFFMETLDTTHFRRKLGEWEVSKPQAFELWGGDTQGFTRDVFTYLDNHLNNRPGSVNLDPDPARAVAKKNVINDFFNFHGHGEHNPVHLSTQAERDTMVRSRRFDRINRAVNAAGDAFPIDYYLQKANFLPAGDEAPTRRPSEREIREHLQAETTSNLSDRLVNPLVSRALAQTIAKGYWDEMFKRIAVKRMASGYHPMEYYRVVAEVMSKTDESQLARLRAAMLKGMAGIKDETQLQAVAATVQLHNEAADAMAPVKDSPLPQAADLETKIGKWGVPNFVESIMGTPLKELAKTEAGAEQVARYITGDHRVKVPIRLSDRDTKRYLALTNKKTGEAIWLPVWSQKGYTNNRDPRVGDPANLRNRPLELAKFIGPGGQWQPEYSFRTKAGRRDLWGKLTPTELENFRQTARGGAGPLLGNDRAAGVMPPQPRPTFEQLDYKGAQNNRPGKLPAFIDRIMGVPLREWAERSYQSAQQIGNLIISDAGVRSGGRFVVMRNQETGQRVWTGTRIQNGHVSVADFTPRKGWRGMEPDFVPIGKFEGPSKPWVREKTMFNEPGAPSRSFGELSQKEYEDLRQQEKDIREGLRDKVTNRYLVLQNKETKEWVWLPVWKSTGRPYIANPANPAAFGVPIQKVIGKGRDWLPEFSFRMKDRSRKAWGRLTPEEVQQLRLDASPYAPGRPYTYLGYQDMSEIPGAKSFHMYNLTEDVPGLGPKGSTVGEDSLRKAGYDPEVPGGVVGKKVTDWQRKTGQTWQEPQVTAEEFYAALPGEGGQTGSEYSPIQPALAKAFWDALVSAKASKLYDKIEELKGFMAANRTGFGGTKNLLHLLDLVEAANPQNYDEFWNAIKEE